MCDYNHSNEVQVTYYGRSIETYYNYDILADEDGRDYDNLDREIRRFIKILISIDGTL